MKRLVMSMKRRVAWQLRVIADALDEGSLWAMLRKELSDARDELAAERAARERLELRLQHAERRASASDRETNK